MRKRLVEKSMIHVRKIEINPSNQLRKVYIERLKCKTVTAILATQESAKAEFFEANLVRFALIDSFACV
jgi:hypothetical protein